MSEKNETSFLSFCIDYSNSMEHDVFYGGNKKIHYHAAGPALGPLIIFIHGWVGTGILWKAQLVTFANEVFVHNFVGTATRMRAHA